MKLPKENGSEAKDDPPEDQHDDDHSNGTVNGSGVQHRQNPPVVPPEVHDAHVRGAIDAMFNTSQQTYEQFLPGFSHLTVGEDSLCNVFWNRQTDKTGYQQLFCWAIPFPVTSC